MRFGVQLTTRDGSPPAVMCDIAREAEALGYSSLWIADHVLLPRDNPFPDDTNPGWRGRYQFESMTALAYISARTSRIDIGTSVLILAQRDPIIFAKQAATINSFSSGRLKLGVGAGWSPDEFSLLHADFKGRGRRTEEYIALCRELWTAEDPRVSGETYAFENVCFRPRVAEARCIPILIGGNSRIAARRAARIGDGWMPSGLGADFTPEDYADSAKEFVNALRAQGRPTSDVPVYLKLRLAFDDIRSPAPLRGSSHQIRSNVERFRDLGVDTLIIDWHGPPDSAQAHYDIARFAAEIMGEFTDTGHDRNSARSS